MRLPKPKGKLGYTKAEVNAICRERGIHHQTFARAFGVNTMAMGEDGEVCYYQCDVEKALWRLKKAGGKFHLWD